MPRFNHFSTRADFEQLTAAHELFAKLYFLREGFLESEEVHFIHGLLSLPDLGIISHPRYYHAGPTYMVFPEVPKLGVIRLPDFNGKKRFTLDGSTFPVCLQFIPNGSWGEKTLICGHVEVTNPVGDTVKLYKEIAKCFAKEYVKTKYFKDVTYVGSDALALKAKRWRLCANPNLKRADDVKIEANGK